MAPVTGGVANAEKDGFVFGAGAGERFLAPGIPIDGVLGVLEQVRGERGGESVHRKPLNKREVV
jgi:hypothetical protein